ncbi:MAG: Crp/Fnr family transcriptional regulator [Thermodesulfobacteriota bacterium]
MEHIDIIKQLHESLNSISDISIAKVEKLVQTAAIRTMERGERYIREGDIPDSLGFVLRGLLRSYYTTEDGKEFTKLFSEENSLVVSYSALIEGRESYFTIQALEDSVLLDFAFEDWVELTKDDLEFHKISLVFLQQAFTLKESRERAFLLFDAAQKYEDFIKQHPSLIKRVKQHQIASYLGMSPVTLSRLIKKSKS